MNENRPLVAKLEYSTHYGGQEPQLRDEGHHPWHKPYRGTKVYKSQFLPVMTLEFADLLSELAFAYDDTYENPV